MKRIVKYSLSILALLLLTLLAIPFFLDVEDYRQQIEQEVSDATGRSLHIGHLEASLFPWVGITLNDVRLANRQGFSTQDFLQVNKLDVQIALLPLLRKKIEIKRFVLEAPHVFLEKNKLGENNWQDLMLRSQVSVIASVSANAQAKYDQNAVISPFLAGLTADQMVLNHGSLIWNDAQKEQHVVVTAIHVQLDDVQLDHPVQVQMSAKLNQDEIKLDAQVGPLGRINDIEFNHLPVQLHLQSFGLNLAPWASLLPPLPAILGEIKDAKVRFDMQLEQRPDGARLLAGQLSLLAAMRLALDWKMEMPNVNTLDMHDVSLKVNDQHVLKVEGKVKDLSKDFHYQIRLQTDALQRLWLATLMPELETMYAGNAQAWQKIKLGASLAGTSQHLEIRDLQCELNDEVMQASGNIDFSGAPDIRLRIAAKHLNLAPWLPKAAETAMIDTYATSPEDGYGQSPAAEPVAISESIPVEQAVEPDLRFLKPWRVALQVQIEQLLVQGLDVTHLHTLLNGQKGVFILNPLQFELAGGAVLATAHMNVNTYPVQWRKTLTMTGVKILPILQALTTSDMLDGTLKLNSSFSAVGLLPESIRSGLEGTAQFSLLNGRIKGFDVAGSLRNMGSFGQISASKATDFAQLQGSIQIHQGLIKNNDLFMASPLFRLSGQGVISLPNMRMDYHVRPKLIGSLIGQGDQNKQRYGVTVPLHIEGPFEQLSITPEITADQVLKEVERLGKKNPKLGKLMKKMNKEPVQKLLKQGLNQKQKEQVSHALKGLLGL